MIVVAIVTQFAGYGFSLAIGFPLPFTMTLMSPPYLTQLLALLLLASASHLRSCPSARSAIQSAISVLMGCIRVAYKNAISRCIREHGDRRSEIVSFQAEIPSALFVAFSMQNASSMLPVALLLVMDVVHAALALYDVHHLVQRIAELETESWDFPILWAASQGQLGCFRLNEDSIKPSQYHDRSRASCHV